MGWRKCESSFQTVEHEKNPASREARNTSAREAGSVAICSVHLPLSAIQAISQSLRVLELQPDLTVDSGKGVIAWCYQTHTCTIFIVAKR